MNEEKQEEPKIIVDDDWKSQVEAEKEQAQQDLDHQASDEPMLPPADFSFILQSFVSQAMFGLGQFPDPSTGKPVINKAIAKHSIDCLGVLEEKTKGNLSEDEAGMLTNMLHHLRMAFVNTPDEIPEPGESNPPESKIELP